MSSRRQKSVSTARAKIILPIELVQLQHAVWEAIMDLDRTAWHDEFMNAIPAGADLDLVPCRLKIWLLTCPELNLKAKADLEGKIAIELVLLSPETSPRGPCPR